MLCQGTKRAGEEEAGRDPQGILRKGKTLQSSGLEELDPDLVNFAPVFLFQSLCLGCAHQEPPTRCVGVKKPPGIVVVASAATPLRLG